MFRYTLRYSGPFLSTCEVIDLAYSRIVATFYTPAAHATAKRLVSRLNKGR